MTTRSIARAALLVPVLLLAAACQRPAKPLRWEYKVVHVNADQNHDRTGMAAGKFQTVTPSEDALTELGQEGWELVGTYLEMETAWINFGNEGYVTGLQPNVRPQRVVMILKRPAPAEEAGKDPAKPAKPGDEKPAKG